MTSRFQSSTTINIEELTIKLHAAGCEFSSALSHDFLLSVDFSYLPGYDPILDGPMEDADPGAAPEVDITSLTPAASIEFESDDGIKLTLPMDYDMLPLFTRHQLEKIEEIISQKVDDGEFNND